jgi:hypothetical protein
VCSAARWNPRRDPNRPGRLAVSVARRTRVSVTRPTTDPGRGAHPGGGEKGGHREQRRCTAPGQPPLGRVGAVADHLRPGRERAGLGRRCADLVDIPDLEPARQADRHLRAPRRLGGSFLRPRGHIARGSWLFGARSRVGWLPDPRGHPPARSRHTAGRSRSRRSLAAADPPDEDAATSTGRPRHSPTSVTPTTSPATFRPPAMHGSKPCASAKNCVIPVPNSSGPGSMTSTGRHRQPSGLTPAP